MRTTAGSLLTPGVRRAPGQPKCRSPVCLRSRRHPRAARIPPTQTQRPLRLHLATRCRRLRTRRSRTAEKTWARRRRLHVRGESYPVLDIQGPVVVIYIYQLINNEVKVEKLEYRKPVEAEPAAAAA